MTDDISFSLYTSNNGILTKTKYPNSEGGIETIVGNLLSSGTVETISIPFQDFPSFIRGCKHNQAIGHGVCDYGHADIVSSWKFNGQPQTVTRTKEFFKYPDGPGIGMFDHDPKPGQTPLSPDDLKEIISSIYPPFAAVATVYTPSTSSCIFAKDGTELSGISAGFHLYFPVKNATCLPEFADILFKRLCLAGHGYAFITRPGRVSLRTIFDASVFSPERLDFVAGADCVDCMQVLPEPIFSDGGML